MKAGARGSKRARSLLGQLLMIPVEDASSLTSLLRLLLPEDAEPFLGQALAGPTGYNGHGSLLSEMQDVAYTCHLTKEAGLQKTSKKGRSRTQEPRNNNLSNYLRGRMA